MRFHIALLASLQVIPLSTAAAQAAPRALSDSARLQGHWTMVSGSADGSVLPASMLQTMSRTLTGNHLSVTMSGQVYFDAIVALHPDSVPRAIDYHMKAGVTAGALELGIYRWAGDTVEFSLAAPGEPRPHDFSDASGSHRTHSRWIRAPH
jgi:uncharacterized protein (TIGR03067 family)